MKKYAQILNERVHWIFEAEEKPEFHPSIVIIDITDKPDYIQEGWSYIDGEFEPPSDEPSDNTEEQLNKPTLDDKLEQVQMDNTILMMAIASLANQQSELKQDISMDNTVLMMALADLNVKVEALQKDQSK